MPSKVWGELGIHSWTLTAALLKIRSGHVIILRFSLICLLIHFEIKINLCYQKDPRDAYNCSLTHSENIYITHLFWHVSSIGEGLKDHFVNKRDQMSTMAIWPHIYRYHLSDVALNFCRQLIIFRGWSPNLSLREWRGTLFQFRKRFAFEHPKPFYHVFTMNNW